MTSLWKFVCFVSSGLLLAPNILFWKGKNLLTGGLVSYERILPIFGNRFMKYCQFWDFAGSSKYFVDKVICYRLVTSFLFYECSQKFSKNTEVLTLKTLSKLHLWTLIVRLAFVLSNFAGRTDESWSMALGCITWIRLTNN